MEDVLGGIYIFSGLDLRNLSAVGLARGMDGGEGSGAVARLAVHCSVGEGVIHRRFVVVARAGN